MPLDLEAIRAKLAAVPTVRTTGRVLGVTGLSLRFALPAVRIGDVVLVQRRGEPLACEVVGFDGGEAIGMALGPLAGVGPDDVVEGTGGPLQVRASQALLGRVVDGLGRPFDGGAPIRGELVTVDRDPPAALERRPIASPLVTGVRVLDGLLTLGEGQRIGLFAGSGVGKSTLLGAMSRQNSADVSVIAMIGERNREVRGFLEKELGPEGRKRSVVVVATSERPAPLRVRACFLSLAVAEYFRDQGASVLLVMDSVTRLAMAQREIGLAAGEPPSQKGYTPSVFNLLPKVLERAGNFRRGSITGFFTVLVEGDDFNEPICDAVRAILDGHIVLSRRLAAENHYPAIDILHSVSRLTSQIATPPQKKAAARLRQALAVYRDSEDLIQLGAYVAGSNPSLDASMQLRPELLEFLRQDQTSNSSREETLSRLERLATSLEASRAVNDARAVKA